MRASTAYDATFYQDQKDGSRRSANVVLPLVTDLIAVKSVLDVGCGLGTWLAACRALGITDVAGVDGDYVDRSQLAIPAEAFHPHDLRESFRLGRRFDLAISLEVAEHLPREVAPKFVETITSHANAVLFSAAIPYQGGADHINEQWPQYWVDLFAERGFRVIDDLRRRVWENKSVEWWYAQNLLLFVHDELLATNPRLRALADASAGRALPLVHPTKYLVESDPTLWSVTSGLARIRTAVRRRLGLKPNS